MLRAVFLISFSWILTACLAFPGPQQPSPGLNGQGEYDVRPVAEQGANPGTQDLSGVSSGQTGLEANRAEVAGILARFIFLSQKQTYLFVVNEYSGEEVIRQSACRIATTQRGGGKRLRSDCFEISDDLRGDVTMMDLWKVQFKYFEHSLRPKEETLKKTFDVGLNLEHFRRFNMEFIFDGQQSNKKLIGTEVWDCQLMGKSLGATQCLWKPESNAERNIEPYHWLP